MEVTTAQSLTLALFLLVPVCLGTASLCLYSRHSLSLHRSPRGRSFLSFLNCFAGGFFLGTCLLVVLDQGIAKFDEYRHLVGLGYTYPFFEAGIGLGFFLTALGEKLVQVLVARATQQGDKSREGFSILEMTPTRTPPHTPTDSDNDLYEDVDAGSAKGILPQPGAKDHVQNSVDGGASSLSPSHSPPLQHGLPGQNGRRAQARSQDAEDTTSDEGGKYQGGSDVVTVSGSASGFRFLRVMLLLLALSFHTVFDGLAVGLQTDVTKVLTLMTAIVFHKAVMSIVLGVELAAVFDGKRPHHPLLALLLFSLASPVGVAIGMGVTLGHVHQSATLLTEAVLQAVATGVFLYVTCFEILERDMASREDRAVARVLTALLGFLFVMALETATA
ncbi:zinc transporter ZIP1-like [Babylonia areolata]|uniref:zinc transporter ZIP1-like n=1 Tax=Babylonia areolata TaxID=304850 RepID=UPI003FD694C5